MKKLYLLLKTVMPYVFWSLITIVTALMLIELPHAEGGWPYWDKVQHAVVFLTLGVAGGLALPTKKRWLFLGLIIFGALIEVLQGVFTATRVPSALDWLADTVGIFIAIFIIWIRKVTKKTN